MQGSSSPLRCEERKDNHSNKKKKVQDTKVINTLWTTHIKGSQSSLSYNIFLAFIIYKLRTNILALKI
jgi:hypothetical protein